MRDHDRDLRQQLCEFIMHEVTPVESILGQHTLPTVFQELGSILTTAEPDSVSHALGFVRDAALYVHPFRDAFQQYLEGSEVWEAFRVLLRTPNVHVRRNAIYTIGKLSRGGRDYLLAEAFPFYVENDPINLPGLLFELRWLTGQWNWDFIQRVASSTHYLVRWSLCEVLERCAGSSRETSLRALEILAQLKRDSNSLIVNEATLRFERIDVRLGPKLPRAVWRKEVKRISRLEPKVTFRYAAMRFMNNTQSDYSLDDFDRFVSGLA